MGGKRNTPTCTFGPLLVMRLLLLILTATTDTTYAIDKSYEKTRIIMQTDVETLIIHTDLTDSLDKLKDIKGELRLARLSLTINNIG